MKCLLMLMLLALLCTSCTALPAEERAFAVALCVGKAGAAWHVHGRIPTYQTGGGYLTVTGEGASLSAALADMDAAAPMHVNLSQLRLLVLEKVLADAGEIPAVLYELSQRADMRPQCAVAVTDAPAKDAAEALKPASGARLSKSIDVLLDTRVEQGGILPAAMADLLRMGERQSPVLIALTLEGKEVSLSGGYPLNVGMQAGMRLSPAETALLSMLRGHAKTLRLNLAGGSAQVRDASARISLSEDMRTATVKLSLRVTDASFTPDGLEQIIADEITSLLSRLSAEGCDVLGLGRDAVRYMHDMAEWHDLNWAELYRHMHWSVSVRVVGPA